MIAQNQSSQIDAFIFFRESSQIPSRTNYKINVRFRKDRYESFQEMNKRFTPGYYTHFSFLRHGARSYVTTWCCSRGVGWECFRQPDTYQSKYNDIELTQNLVERYLKAHRYHITLNNYIIPIWKSWMCESICLCKFSHSLCYILNKISRLRFVTILENVEASF